MSGQSPTEINSVIERFSEHHHTEWLYDRQIVIVPSLGTPQRALVDDWCRMLKTIFDQWPTDRPVLLLADLTRKSSPSPYQTAKANEVLSYRTDLKSCIAAVTRNNLSGQIARLTIRVKGRRNGQIEHFFSRESALKWLLKVGNINKPTTL